MFSATTLTTCSTRRVFSKLNLISKQMSLGRLIRLTNNINYGTADTVILLKSIISIHSTPINIYLLLCWCSFIASGNIELQKSAIVKYRIVARERRKVY